MNIMFKYAGSDIPCDIHRNKYCGNGNLALEAVISESGVDNYGFEYFGGEPMATLSVNIIDLPKNQCALDTNNCPYIREEFETRNIGRYAGFDIPSGFCLYPVWEFTDEEIEKFVDASVLY